MADESDSINALLDTVGGGDDGGDGPGPFDPNDISLDSFETAKCPECGNAMTISKGSDDPECPQGCGLMTDRYATPGLDSVEVDLLALGDVIKDSSAAQGLDYYVVEVLGLSGAEWAALTGRNRSTVSRNIRRSEGSDE